MDEDKQEAPSEGEEREKVLNLYLKELIARQDHALLTEKDAARLEEEFPLDEEEKEKVLMLAHRHILRAEQYRKQEKWDTAIVETERALLFTPLDLDRRLDLAELYILRSRQYGYLEKDLDRAAAKIRETLILRPSYKKALKMQRELQGLNRMLKGKDQNRKFLPLALGLLLILGAVLYPRVKAFVFRFWLPREETAREAGPPEEAPWSERALRVETNDALREEADLEMTRALLEKNEEGYAVSLQGYLRPRKGPLEELTLTLSMGDPSAPVFEKDLVLLDESRPILADGETLPFGAHYRLTASPGESGEIRLALGSFKPAYPGEEESSWRETPPLWEVPRPEGLNLSFATRETCPLEGYDRIYQSQDIRLRNNSFAPVQGLRVALAWYDREDREMFRRELDFVPPGNPPIPGESTVSLRVVLDLPLAADPLPAARSVSILEVIKEGNREE